MRKLFLIPVIILFSLLIHQNIYAYDVSVIAKEIENFSPVINADSGDIEKVLKDTFNYDPRLMMYYKGYTGSYNSVYSKINIIYNNQDTDINKIYVAKNKEEFISLITRALLYNESKLYIVAENMPTNSTPINDYITSVNKICPIAFMGYRSSNTFTLDSKILNYSCYVINFNYDFDNSTLLQMKKNLEQKACEIVASNIAKNMPPYMKVYIIHNYIINNCKYATDYETNDDPSYYTAYGALINGQAVCDGYASAAQILFDLCSIENIKVSGTSKGNGHAWNIIKLDNDYYHIDTTWDDPVSYDGFNHLRYDYYNITDDEISADHTWDTAVYPQANGSSYNYKKTCELIFNDKNDYKDGYTRFESVFSKYPQLTGSVNGNLEKETEFTTLQIIEPVSILDKADYNLNIRIYYIMKYIMLNIKNYLQLSIRIFIIILLFILLKKLFIRKK